MCVITKNKLKPNNRNTESLNPPEQNITGYVRWCHSASQHKDNAQSDVKTVIKTTLHE